VPVYILGFDPLDSFLHSFGAATESELGEKLGLDALLSWPAYVGPEPPPNQTIWGTLVPGGTGGYSQSRGGQPLAGAATVAEVEAHPWPSPDNLDYAAVSSGLSGAGDRARLIGLLWEPAFCRVMDLFGMEQAMMNMHAQPALIEAAVDHITGYVLEAAERTIKAARGIADIFRYEDDFGTQRGLMISPEHWRRFFKPVYARVFALARSHGLKTWIHSCGSFVDVLPDLIDIGMDVWETSQFHLEANDPHRLKREFGASMTFYGGISTQTTLPRGSPDSVRREVRDRIDVLARGGGYICGPDHLLRGEVPMENTLAMLDEAKRYGGVADGTGPAVRNMRGPA
jgi:uroporphyrinogen decarboxylase